MEPRRFDSHSDRLSPRQGSETGRALVIEPHLRSRLGPTAEARAKAALRSPAARLDEAVGLARAIDLNVISSGIVPLGEIRPATFVGKGKLEEIAGLVEIEVGDAITIAAPQPLSLGPEMPVELVAACVGLKPGDVLTKAHKPVSASVGNSLPAQRA